MVQEAEARPVVMRVVAAVAQSSLRLATKSILREQSKPMVVGRAGLRVIVRMKTRQVVAVGQFDLWLRELADKGALIQADGARAMCGLEVAGFDSIRIKVFLAAVLVARSHKVRSSSSFRPQVSCRN